MKGEPEQEAPKKLKKLKAPKAPKAPRKPKVVKETVGSWFGCDFHRFLLLMQHSFADVMHSPVTAPKQA